MDAADMDNNGDDNFSGSGDAGDVAVRRLVISIDFGTTYTGIAYATPLGQDISLSDVDIVTYWGEKLSNSEKVPTVQSYSQRSDKHEANWGGDLAPDAVAMKHMKLRLNAQSVSNELDFLLQLLDGTRNLDFSYIKSTKGMPDYTEKSPEDIVIDFLSNVFRYVLDRVNEFSVTVRKEIPADLVITIPVGWSYAAKNSTYRAVVKAGFNKTTFPKLEDTMFISEPEAAAVHTTRYFKDIDKEILREGECFILVDAGGGTVDIVSYEVESLSPLTLKPIGVPTGSRCGSIFIDVEFKRWLRALLGDENYLKLDPQADLNNMYGIECEAIRYIMAKFDTIKKEFQQDSGDEFFDLPPPLKNLTIPGVDMGQVTITNKDMRRFFEPCINNIIRDIKRHIRQIDDDGTSVENVFLIGGFGGSEYLKQEIAKSLKRRNEIELHRPETSWTAVARGAVICGVEKATTTNLIRTTATTKSYGIAVNEAYSYSHDERDLEPHPVTGRMTACNQMRWLINKGDLIMDTEPTVKEHNFTVRFAEHELEKRKGQVQIYSWSRDRRRPKRLLNAMRDLGYEDILEYDFLSCPLSDFTERREQSGTYYTTTVTLRLTLAYDNANLKAELLWKQGEPVPRSAYGAPRSSPQVMSSMAAGMAGLGLGPGSNTGTAGGAWAVLNRSRVPNTDQSGPGSNTGMAGGAWAVPNRPRGPSTGQSGSLRYA